MSLDERLFEVVDLAYQAALQPAVWSDVLDGLAESMGGSAAAVLWRMPGGSHGGLGRGLPDDAVSTYWGRYASINPIQRGFDRLRAVQPSDTAVLTDQACVPRDELLRSETFNEFMRPRGLDSVMLLGAETTPGLAGVAAFNVFRARGAQAFDAEELRTGHTLRAPLMRAFQMSLRLGAERRLAEGLAAFIDRLEGAVFIADGEGRICYANAAAEAMVADGDGLTTVGGALRARSADAHRDLIRLLARAAGPAERRGGALALPRASGRRALALLATPATATDDPASPALALVSVVDPEAELEPGEARLRAYFGFTPAEARVAAELVAGYGPEEIAARLGLALNTVRLQVARVREKTGTRRQGEFISLVLRTLGGRRSDDA